MRIVRTEILIDAPAEAVWRELTDFAAMPAWNPFIERIEGQAREGARLKIRISNGRGGGMSFRPRVLAARPPHELRWLGRLFVPGLFDGEHAFELFAEGPQRTRFVHSERFTGLLVGLMSGALDETEAGFRRMNEALKRRVEGSLGPASHAEVPDEAPAAAPVPAA